ncbi:hypothetical protein ES703_101026 [subsurface metagenome]
MFINKNRVGVDVAAAEDVVATGIVCVRNDGVVDDNIRVGWPAGLRVKVRFPNQIFERPDVFPEDVSIKVGAAARAAYISAFFTKLDGCII